MSKAIKKTVNLNGEWQVADNVSLFPRRPEAVMVGSVSTLIVGENVRRRGLIIINMSWSFISLGFGVDAELNKGVIILPGGAFNMGEEDFYTGSIYGIASVSDNLVTVQEFL